ncbi:hypothetical protein JHK82_020576 [Glycine max]|nr:hypothetical protein JHK85_021032 [Glycine max]KAG5135845.1 hypothetical protein JHK82_020576 [Glycine max]KAH1236213.1 External alternative NAD(P)H-ubiquinone oxidoreductase B2, mitochondrial [Glycine max]
MWSFTFFERVSRAFRDHGSNFKLVLLCTTVSGGGVLAYGEAVAASEAAATTTEKKKVVVLGTGWAGTSFLRNLDNPKYEVHVVSPRNYFAFTPLLPSVTCGTVEARSIVEPVRNIFRKKKMDMQFSEAECLKIDATNRKVYCRSNISNNLNEKEEFVVDYDYLIIAVGANVNTFNTPGVMENCHFLKEVEDAQKIRRTVIDCFERASLPSVSEEEKKRILHFAIVGGGPTGVEFAASLHDYVTEDLVNIYPGIKDLVKITLLEAGDHILSMFDKRITAFAEEKFGRDGIDVKTGSMVVKVSQKEISTKEMKNGGAITTIPYGMAVWSTGIGTRPFIRDFMSQIGQADIVGVDWEQLLRLEGREVQRQPHHHNQHRFAITRRNASSGSELTLQNNALSGALPSLANLSMLESVFLSSNNFTSAPDGCFQGLTSLQTLSMTDRINLAPWTIPVELNDNNNLVKLELGNANLIGTLPDVFDKFVSLQELRLSYNNLTGGLPKSFARSAIQDMWLNNQNGFGFSGTIETNRRAIATDEWLRVEATNNVYALGDCATINQRKVMEDIAAIFKKADKDNSGTLTVKEFQEVLADICERYPQVELYLKSQQMHNIADLLKGSKEDVEKESIELNIEELKTILSKVDSQMKFLPATAQVASQQGTYLAKCFNRMEECEKNPEGPIRFRGEGRHRFKPFRYKHLGQFAPLGGEQTAAQLPGDWVSIGHSSQWLWYSVYASKQVSWRTRALVVSDWTRRFIFGRDSSQI